MSLTSGMEGELTEDFVKEIVKEIVAVAVKLHNNVVGI